MGGKGRGTTKQHPVWLMQGKAVQQFIVLCTASTWRHEKVQAVPWSPAGLLRARHTSAGSARGIRRDSFQRQSNCVCVAQPTWPGFLFALLHCCATFRQWLSDIQVLSQHAKTFSYPPRTGFGGGPLPAAQISHVCSRCFLSHNWNFF